jgi:hypothetical protein
LLMVRFPTPSSRITLGLNNEPVSIMSSSGVST